VFDNTILHGLSGWPTQTIQIFIVEMFDGINLQAALSTIFARILGTDILSIHLFFIPTLWGTFIPVASFLTTRAIGGSEKAAVVSSLLVSTFPYTIYFGAISVPNSLGFIFFFYSLYFMLRYLSSNDSKMARWMVAFSLFSFLSHYLAGVISFSLLLLSIGFKTFKSHKKPSSTDARTSLVILFFVCVSLLPLSFIYLRLLGTSANPTFTLRKLNEMPSQEIIGLFLLGEAYNFDLKTIILFIIGPILAFLSMICLLFRLEKNTAAESRSQIHFLFAAFLTILIDYRILTLFMQGLPINAERLWVFSDFIATPFLALAINSIATSLRAFQKTKPPQTKSVAKKPSPKTRAPRVVDVLLASNILIPILIGGWVTLSLSVAYPQVAPLQTTWYELEAIKFIEANTQENYVVIGDQWTVYAGEVIVGVNNPKACYFEEFSRVRIELFVNMRQNPSSQWMLQAMNYTDTTIAYFIVTEPRLGTEEFNGVVSRALQNEQLQLVDTFGDGKLYVFSYRKG